MKGLSLLKPLKSFIYGLTLLLPAYAFAIDHYASQLANNSKTAKSTGYYLTQDKTWGESGCIISPGKEKLNPGDITLLKIKKNCKWGGVGYQIHDMKDGTLMGFLAHSFRDGKFFVEITDSCINNQCVFRDLSPEQNR